MKIKNYIILLVVITSVSCDSYTGSNNLDEHNINTDQLPQINIEETNPPFDIVSGASFYEDITYGTHERNRFDFFSPNSEEPTPLLIIIHGGGFTGGDKSDYSLIAELIQQLLVRDISVASINYRFIGAVDGMGVLNSLNDSKRALQYIRYFSDELNIDKSKVVLLGSSAGAGTSLWIGLNDDMAIETSDDLILRESTRVKAIVALSTQSSYDIVEWPNSTFSEYQGQGMTFDTLLNLVGEDTLLDFYGIDEIDDVYREPILSNRARLDMLDLISEDDPEFMVASSDVLYEYPADGDALLHHPLHAKALIDKAASEGVDYKAYLPGLGINDGENFAAFIVRKLGE